MAVLVSGGAGFIGSHLCEKLINEGRKVICLDVHLEKKNANIAGFKENPNFILAEKSVTEILPDDAIFPGEKIEEIYHLASPTSQKDYRENPVEILMVHAAGTKNLLDLSVKHGAKFLLASSAEIYGYNPAYPLKETDLGTTNTVGARSCYTEGKRFAESLCMAYYNSKKVPVKIARLFNIYGPRMKKGDGRAISEFMIRALKSEEIVIGGDGSQTRTFCYIDDLVDGLTALMKTPDDFTGPVNLGSEEEISILELAKKIIDMTGTNSTIKFIENRSDDPTRRKPDTALAKKLFGFNPKTDLEIGLKKILGDLRQDYI